jgi:hypothetical protein
MKDAILWKRILNEGISRKVCVDLVDEAERKIITATIIVDRRPFHEGQCERPATRLIAIPADTTWVEYPSERPADAVNTRSDAVKRISEGCLFVATRVDGGFRITSYSLTDTRDLGVTMLGKREWSIDVNGRPAVQRTVTISSQWMDKENAVAQVDRICYVACETLELLSCKNVSLEPRDNDPKQVRRAEKRHGINSHGYRYHVLVVRPPGARHDAPSQEIGTMPRHVCRGHFAEYGPEFNKGLLFGKYSGRFYVPPHLKGRTENGEVAKDYAIGSASS